MNHLQSVLMLLILGLLQGCTGGGSAVVTVIDSEDGFLFQENEEAILFYQRAPKSFDGAYTRNNYIHPLWSLEGEALTEDAPDDHLHHRGIFWTWHQVLAGDVICGDAWLCERFSWDVVRAQTGPVPDGGQSLDVTVLWKSPDLVDDKGEALPIVQETSKISVHPRQKTYRCIDFDISLLALQADVAIGGSDDVKGYSGFSLRLKAPEDLSFHSETSTVTPQNTAVAAGQWLDFNATFKDGAGRSGVAVFVHSDNPGATDQWIIRQKRSMQNPVFPGRKPFALSQDQPTILKYRLIIHEGDADQLPLDKMYQTYAQ